MDKYVNTYVTLALLLIFGVGLVLLAPTLHADPAQVAILLGVLVVGIQQLLAIRTAEGNGHRLAQVEKIADVVAIQGQSNADRLDVKDTEMGTDAESHSA